MGRIKEFTSGMFKGMNARAASMLLVMVFMIVVSTLISPIFFTFRNLMNIMNQNAIFGILSIGMAFVIIAGCIDLSVGSIVALAGVLTVDVFINYGLAAGIVLGLLIGAFVGLCNGLLVAGIGMPPFVATLGMQQVIRGIVYVITNGIPVRGVPTQYNFLGYGKIAGVPISMIIWLSLALIMFLVLRFTRYGQHLYAVGGNEHASWLSGVNAKRVKTIAFVLSGIFSALAGVILTLRVLQATADAGTSYETTAIASCIVGGIAMEGGQGNILSSVVGVIIMGLILNMLQLLGVTSYWQSTATGSIIILAVAIDFIAEKRRN
jgi:ribose/xylose/arabinose/galactoside ABC-type transport system permease subunit